MEFRVSTSATEHIARDLRLTLHEAHSVSQAFEHLVLLTHPRSEASIGFHTLCIQRARQMARAAMNLDRERERPFADGAADLMERMPDILATMADLLQPYLTHPIQEEATSE